MTISTPSACRQFETRLNAWIDDPSRIDIQSDDHLTDCSHCRETVLIWNGIERGIRDRVDRSTIVRRKKRIAWFASAAAILMAVVGMRSMLTLDSSATSEGTTPPSGAMIVSGEPLNQTPERLVDPILLGQFINQSRPAITQMGQGIEPLGRTLQRTAGLFY